MNLHDDVLTDEKIYKYSSYLFFKRIGNLFAGQDLGQIQLLKIHLYGHGFIIAFFGRVKNILFF